MSHTELIKGLLAGFLTVGLAGCGSTAAARSASSTSSSDTGTVFRTVDEIKKDGAK